MVTMAIIAAVLWVVRTALAPLPDVQVPAAVQAGGSLESALLGIGDMAGKMSHWIPWGSVLGALTLVFTAVLAMVAIKLLRIVLSFLTAGGGNA